MKVTVNLPDGQVDEEGNALEVDVMHPFALPVGEDGVERTVLIALGVFVNGTENEVDDVRVLAYGALPVDVLVGEPLAPPVTEPETVIDTSPPPAEEPVPLEHVEAPVVVDPPANTEGTVA